MLFCVSSTSRILCLPSDQSTCIRHDPPQNGAIVLCGEDELLNKVVISVFFVHKVFVALYNDSLTTDVTWTILMMSLLPFRALTVSVVLMSMEGQKALGFHHKYLNLCSEDERRSYRFGTTRG